MFVAKNDIVKLRCSCLASNVLACASIATLVICCRLDAVKFKLYCLHRSSGPSMHSGNPRVTSLYRFTSMSSCITAGLIFAAMVGLFLCDGSLSGI